MKNNTNNRNYFNTFNNKLQRIQKGDNIKAVFTNSDGSKRVLNLNDNIFFNNKGKKLTKKIIIKNLNTLKTDFNAIRIKI